MRWMQDVKERSGRQCQHRLICRVGKRFIKAPPPTSRDGSVRLFTSYNVPCLHPFPARPLNCISFLINSFLFHL